MSNTQSMSAKHTPGPWRWEINLTSKSVHLVGGLRPQYDLTIIDFDRWGMNRATMSLRDTAHDGFNIMHKLHERPDWIAPFPGRAHHADWCSDVVHPDARLIAAAPDLLAAVNGLLATFHCAEFAPGESPTVDMARAAIRAATGEAK